MLLTVGSEEPDYLLVQTFRLTVGLWVIARRQADVNIQVFEERGPNSGGELGATNQYLVAE